MSTIKVDAITDELGTGSPDFPNGITVNGSPLTGLATAAQGALADSAVQPTDSLASANLTGALPAIDGSSLTGISSAPTTAQVLTATAGLLNLIDGGTARGTTALADGDGILINDAGTMRMSTVQTVKTYMTDGVGASTTFGAVGTYMFGRAPNSVGAQPSFNFGSTYAGSGLHPAGLAGSSVVLSGSAYYYSTNTGIGLSTAPASSGTWRCVGQTPPPSLDEMPATLFVRIS